MHWICMPLPPHPFKLVSLALKLALFFIWKSCFFFMEVWCCPFLKFFIFIFDVNLPSFSLWVKVKYFDATTTLLPKLREEFFSRVAGNLCRALESLSTLLYILSQPQRLEMPAWHFTDLLPQEEPLPQEIFCWQAENKYFQGLLTC